MSETSSRLLKLLSLLQARKEWTGSELADRLSVTTRTVRNDIDRLRDMGYPVNATRGSIGGYQLGAGAELPPLLLDDDEAVAIALGLRNAATGGIEGIEESSLRALNKLEQVLPHRLQRQVATLQNFTVPVTAPEGPKVDASTLTLIAAACRDSEQLRFLYNDRSRTPTRRTVEPYRLVNWGRRWYLVAWDTNRKDWRTFRVDRIEPQPPAGPRFTPRPLPSEDVAAYITQGIAAAGWKVQAQVIVYESGESLAKRFGRWAGTIEAIDDSRCILNTGGNDADSLAAHLALLNVDFKVTGPPELVDAMARIEQRFRRAVSGDSE